jgi:lysophospholipase L1-like esterase
MTPRPRSKTPLATLVTVVALSLGCERAAPAAALDAPLIDPRDAVDAAKTDDLAAAPDAVDASVTGDVSVPSDVALDARPDAPLDAAVTDAAAWDAGPAPCAEVDRFTPIFGAQIARWAAQDALAPWAPGGVVFVGSSSIRRWEGLSRDFADYAPIQRGVGGAQLGEVARFTRDLVVRYAPRAVVVYAGTNDLALDVAPAVALDRFRCLRHRLGEGLGWTTPVLFVGVVPNPSRWARWSTARSFNAAVAALAADDPGLVYVDGATPFLATGSPPDASLFVSDGLHLSARGYDLWRAPIRAALEAVARPLPHASAPARALPVGARVLVDLGPSNPEDGEATPSPDYMGQRWNNWHALAAPGGALAGERLASLVTTTGAPTGVDLVIAGGFLANGRRSGGLLWPEAARLGSLAVGSATGDFFYTQDADAPGALSLRGLDPSRTYTLRLFAARDASEVRVTRYTVRGAATATVTLQTSGPGAGRGGATTNDDDVAEVRGARPDAWGTLFVDVAIERGAFAYLSAFELIAE